MAMEAPAAFFHCLDALAAFFNGSGAPVALFHGYTTIHGACCGCNNGAVPRVACGGTCTTVALLAISRSFQANFQRSPMAAMASAHGVLGRVDWLRDLINMMKPFVHRFNAI